MSEHLYLYVDYMGWSMSDGTARTARYTVRQGHMTAKTTVIGLKHTTHFYVSQTPLATIRFDGEQARAFKGSEPFDLRRELLEEHVATVALLSNALTGAESLAIPGGDMTRFFNAQRIRLRPRGGSPINLWIDAKSGQLVSAIIECPPRRVNFVPLDTARMRRGRRFFTAWGRDNEVPMQIEELFLNERLSDADLV